MRRGNRSRAKEGLRRVTLISGEYLWFLVTNLKLIQAVQVDEGGVGLVQSLPLPLACVLKVSPLAGQVLLAGKVAAAAKLLALRVDRHQPGLVACHLSLGPGVLLD